MWKSQINKALGNPSYKNRQKKMSADKPTILVTGGAGYIGSHAVLA
jgi:UDP-glucose 4-epimerase